MAGFSAAGINAVLTAHLDPRPSPSRAETVKRNIPHEPLCTAARSCFFFLAVFCVGWIEKRSGYLAAYLCTYISCCHLVLQLENGGRTICLTGGGDIEWLPDERTGGAQGGSFFRVTRGCE
jgi:hypothetical protein